MGIYGTVVLEDQVVQFGVDPIEQKGEYSVTDNRTGKSFKAENVSGRAICAMLALAISWDGEPVTEEDRKMAEKIQSPDADLRVIP